RGAFVPHDAPADKEFFVSKSVTAGVGNIDRLDFVSSRNSYDDERECESDVTELGYQLLPNYEETSLYRLMRREDPFIDDKPTTGGSLAQLHDRVKSVKFEFFDGQEWLPEWNNTKKSGKLPEAVRVEIILSMPQLGSISDVEEYEPTFSTTISLPR
ncbi:MAG: type II secretion system protein GspJ, partial [Planctomycetota bacterium]|nr:type II secretion system protein GspJ [Planctomycetota bacterium]